MRLKAEQALACTPGCLTPMGQHSRRIAWLRAFHAQLSPAEHSLLQQQVIQRVTAERVCRFRQRKPFLTNSDVQDRARDTNWTGSEESVPKAKRLQHRGHLGREKLTTDLMPGKPRLFVKRNSAIFAQ